MKKREAQFQTIFGRWVQYAYTGPSFAYELKRTEGKSLALSEIKDHQIQALLQAQQRGFHYKIPDESYTARPFDGFYLKGVLAYVGIAYGKKLERFYLIPVSKIIQLRTDGEVSLREDRAGELGICVEIPRKGKV